MKINKYRKKNVMQKNAGEIKKQKTRKKQETRVPQSPSSFHLSGNVVYSD